jgi:predicted RNA-binding protein
MKKGLSMPRYWILCMSEDNYEIARTQGLIGLAERHKVAIQKLAIGDMMTFYISKKKVDSPPNDPADKVQQFRGMARVTGDAFESNDLIWHVREGEIFPHRRQVEFLAGGSAEARPLIERLSFVTNTSYWALPFRKGYVEVTQKDFDTIHEALAVGSEHS